MQKVSGCPERPQTQRPHAPQDAFTCLDLALLQSGWALWFLHQAENSLPGQRSASTGSARVFACWPAPRGFHMSSVQFCLAFGIRTINNNSWPRVTKAYWLIMEQNTCQRRLLIGPEPVRKKVGKSDAVLSPIWL